MDYRLFFLVLLILPGCTSDILIFEDIYNITGDNITLINATITTLNSTTTQIDSYYNIKQSFTTITEISSSLTQIYTNDTAKGESTICINSTSNVTFIGGC